MDNDSPQPAKINKPHKKKRISIVGSIILTVIALAIVGIIFALTKEQITTTGQYPDNISDKSLVCTGENINYPIFTYDNSIKKEAKVNVLFSQDEMRSIALTYNLYYNDKGAIVASEAHNHATMNISFGANGLGADAFNAKYAKLDNRMQMNLYATVSQIDNASLKYFLIDVEGDRVPNTMTSYKDIYENLGMKCEESK